MSISYDNTEIELGQQSTNWKVLMRRYYRHFIANIKSYDDGLLLADISHMAYWTEVCVAEQSDQNTAVRLATMSNKPMKRLLVNRQTIRWGYVMTWLNVGCRYVLEGSLSSSRVIRPRKLHSSKLNAIWFDGGVVDKSKPVLVKFQVYYVPIKSVEYKVSDFWFGSSSVPFHLVWHRRAYMQYSVACLL